MGGMKMNPEGEGRLAQIAAELLGARAIKQIIEEIWRDAPTDVKVDMGDAVLKQVRQSFQDERFRWEIDRQLEQHIVEVTKKLLSLPSWDDLLRKKIEKALAVAWDDTIAKEVQRCVEQTTKGVLGEIAEAIHEVREK